MQVLAFLSKPSKPDNASEQITELASATERDSDEENSEEKKRAVLLSRVGVCQVLSSNIRR